MNLYEMAEQSNCWFEDTGKLVTDYINLKAFEDLVRAAEREKVEDLLKEYDLVNSAFAKDFRARGETK